MCIPFIVAGVGMGAGMTASTAMMANIAITSSLAAGAFGAISSIQQGNYQSQVAKNNAKIQDQLATDAMNRGEQKEHQARVKAAQEVGYQRAKFGAAGVGVSSGSPSLVLQDTAELGELDSLTVRNNAQREAYGHAVQETNYLAEGELARKKGQWGAVSSILTSAESTSGNLAGLQA